MTAAAPHGPPRPASPARGGGGSGIAWLALVAAAAVLHLVVVVSVLRQPLDVRRSAPERRSLVFPLYNDAVHRIGPGADFFALQRAGVQVRAGRSPYSGVADPADPPYGFAYRYLPLLAATLGRAAAALPPRAAWLAWSLANEALLVALLALWSGACRSRAERAGGAALLLASTPYFLELHMGQFTFAASALAASALLLFERADGRGTRAGATALLGAGALLKIFPLAVLPALRRDRAALLGWGLVAGALAAATLAHGLAAPHDLERFARANLATLSPAPQRGNFGMLYALTAAAREAGVAWTPALFAVCARAWQLAVLGATAVLAWRAPVAALAFGGALCLDGFFLAYQDVWEHHYSGALVASLLVARGLSAARAPRLARALAWAALVALAAPTPFAWLDVDHDWHRLAPWQQWALPLSKAGPLLLLQGLGLGALARWRAGRGAEPA